MSKHFFRLIQMSDIHLFADQKQTLLGVPTEKSFRSVLNLVKKNKSIELLFLSGDLSQDGSKESYLNLARGLNDFDMPIYCVPGNHDNLKIMQEAFSDSKILYAKQFIYKNWQFILLNSQKTNSVPGYLAEGELVFLEKMLKKHPELPTIVIFHHHPISVGSEWLDPLGLLNADQFWERISQANAAPFVLFGHVHQVIEKKQGSVLCFSSPSTSIQFKPFSQTFALDPLPQGYRWIDCYEDGTLSTGVKRLNRYVGHFDNDAKGY